MTQENQVLQEKNQNINNVLFKRAIELTQLNCSSQSVVDDQENEDRNQMTNQDQNQRTVHEQNQNKKDKMTIRDQNQNINTTLDGRAIKFENCTFNHTTFNICNRTQDE